MNNERGNDKALTLDQVRNMDLLKGTEGAIVLSPNGKRVRRGNFFDFETGEVLSVKVIQDKKTRGGGR